MRLKKLSKISKIFIVIVIVTGVIVSGALISKTMTISSIDCKKIQQESKDMEKRGIANNLTTEAIDKCYPN